VGPYTGIYGRIAGDSRDACPRALIIDASAAVEEVGERLWILPAAAIIELARGGNYEGDYRGGRGAACSGASIGLVARAQLEMVVNALEADALEADASEADASEADASEADASDGDRLLGGGTSPPNERTVAFGEDFVADFKDATSNGDLDKAAARAGWNLTAPAQRIGYTRATRTCGPRGNRQSYPRGTFTYLLRVPAGTFALRGHNVTLHAPTAVVVTLTPKTSYERAFCLHASPWPVATPPPPRDAIDTLAPQVWPDNPYGDHLRRDREGVSTTEIIFYSTAGGLFLIFVVVCCCHSCAKKCCCCCCCCCGGDDDNKPTPFLDLPSPSTSTGPSVAQAAPGGGQPSSRGDSQSTARTVPYEMYGGGEGGKGWLTTWRLPVLAERVGKVRRER